MIVFHNSTGRRRYVAAVGSGYKFVHWINGGDEELYCPGEDPDELTNLIDSPSASDVASRLRNACINFERDHGIAANINNNAFVDLPYQPPQSHVMGRYPRWSSFQFPPWTEGYSPEDLEKIAGQMDECGKSSVAYICRDTDWRRDAIEKWRAIGGDPDVYRRLFKAVDTPDNPTQDEPGKA